MKSYSLTVAVRIIIATSLANRYLHQMPDVEPLKGTGVTLKLKQSPTDILPRLSTRVIVCGPSGVGKGVLMMQLLLNPKFYRGCWDQIMYFSQSAKVDSNLLPLKRYCQEELGQKECLYDTFDHELLRKHLDEQLAVVEYVKKQAARKGKRTAKGFQTCDIVDDFADMPSVMRKAGGVLNSLAIRGRHANVSLFVLTQKYRALAPELRRNANAIFFFRQRSRFDLDAFLEENSAVIPRKELEDLYRRATLADHGFLYADLMGSVPSFYSSFKARLIPPSLVDTRRPSLE